MNKCIAFLLAFFFFNITSCSLIIDNNNKESIVLLDSLKINKDSSLYWYKYSPMVGNNSVSYIQLDNSLCNVDKDKAIASGDLILSIDTVLGDEIKVAYIDTVNTLINSKYKIIAYRFSNDSVYKKPRIGKAFFITDLCK